MCERMITMVLKTTSFLKSCIWKSPTLAIVTSFIPFLSYFANQFFTWSHSLIPSKPLTSVLLGGVPCESVTHQFMSLHLSIRKSLWSTVINAFLPMFHAEKTAQYTFFDLTTRWLLPGKVIKLCQLAQLDISDYYQSVGRVALILLFTSR